MISTSSLLPSNNTSSSVIGLLLHKLAAITVSPALTVVLGVGVRLVKTGGMDGNGSAGSGADTVVGAAIRVGAGTVVVGLTSGTTVSITDRTGLMSGAGISVTDPTGLDAGIGVARVGVPEPEPAVASATRVATRAARVAIAWADAVAAGGAPRVAANGTEVARGSGAGARHPTVSKFSPEARNSKPMMTFFNSTPPLTDYLTTQNPLFQPTQPCL